jgi:hypothetical protein
MLEAERDEGGDRKSQPGEFRRNGPAGEDEPDRDADQRVAQDAADESLTWFTDRRKYRIAPPRAKTRAGPGTGNKNPAVAAGL